MKIIRAFLSFLKKKEKIPIPKPINEQALLQGKIALITGGSGGIGFAIAKSYVQHGCKVIISGTNQAKLESCTAQINAIFNNSAKYLILDVSKTDEIEQKVNEAIAMFEEHKLDILVNSSGVNSFNTFFDVTPDEYDRIMNINLKGAFFISQAVSKYMIQYKISGNILNISSASALRPANTPYILSKWGIAGLTQGLADQLYKYGITVNALAPGAVATPMLQKVEGSTIENPNNLIGRYAIPDEIASLAVIMVSDMGKLILGDTLYMTGGSGLLDRHK